MFVLFCVSTILLTGCKEEASSSKNEKISLDTEVKVLKSSEKSRLLYKPQLQKTERVNDPSRYPKKYKLHPDENNFNIGEDNISVVIPVSDSKMTIKNVFNVSDYSNNKTFNAIVIHLSNGLSTVTPDSVSHKIISDLKISKISGLSANYLKEGKLKVYIINEDILDEDEKNAFIKCASQETDYSDLSCNIDTGDLEGESIRPKEQEGDIITGG